MSEPMFPFHTLRSIIAGTSAIDVPHLTVRNLDEAADFVSAYGYDLGDPHDMAQLAALRSEAVAFLDRMLDAAEEIPDAVRDEIDVLRLLRIASQPGHALQRPVCALLRVMHTLAHSSSWFADRYHDAIQRQILARVEPFLHSDASGQQFLADVPLVRFEVRARKERWSLALKLLHKAENVAADVFDYVGLRFVTRDRLDALLVVRALRSRNMIMFANVKPSRSRNTLVDLDRLEAWLEDHPEPDLEVLRAEVEAWAAPGGDPRRNRYSDAAYQSLQFTGRQRIHVKDASGRPIRFFFPFEVQILDEESFRVSREGFASHDEYKRRQVADARRRVLGKAG
jgi:uncharacterized protein (TIGR04562 family)